MKRRAGRAAVVVNDSVQLARWEAVLDTLVPTGRSHGPLDGHPRSHLLITSTQEKKSGNTLAFVCSATWTAQPGKEDVVRGALVELAPASRNEPGCQTYIVHTDPEQPAVFKIFEVYDDEDAFKAHGSYPHFQKFALGQSIPALADRERVFTTVLDV